MNGRHTKLRRLGLYLVACLNIVPVVYGPWHSLMSVNKWIASIKPGCCYYLEKSPNCDYRHVLAFHSGDFISKDLNFMNTTHRRISPVLTGSVDG